LKIWRGRFPSQTHRVADESPERDDHEKTMLSVLCLQNIHSEWFHQEERLNHNSSQHSLHR
jgi:hypothetical protein